MPTPRPTPQLELIEGGRQGLIRRLIRALAMHQDAALAADLERLERRAALKTLDKQALSDPADRAPTAA